MAEQAQGGPIEFYFDFSSPYGYLASCVVDDVGKTLGREVVWYPILLGAVFKVTGNKPLMHQPLKGDYLAHDMERFARLLGQPYQKPMRFPFNAVAACRAFYWLEEKSATKAKALAKAVFRGAYEFSRPVDEPDLLVTELEDQLGNWSVNSDQLRKALTDQRIKDLTRQKVEQAMEKGVFGSPYFIVDGEPFFGVDRLGQLQHWVEKGGW